MTIVNNTILHTRNLLRVISGILTTKSKSNCEDMTMLMSLIVIIISPFVCVCVCIYIYIHTIGSQRVRHDWATKHTHTHNYHGIDIKIYNFYLKIFNGIKTLILDLKKLPYLLYPFIRWWTLRLLPGLDHCK